MPDPVHEKHISVNITRDGRNSIPVPAGTSRKVMFNNGQNDPVYVAFGDKNIIADDEDVALDFGYTEMMVPDDAAFIGFYATTDRGIVCAFTFQEKMKDIGLPGKPGLIQPSPIEPPSDEESI